MKPFVIIFFLLAASLAWAAGPTQSDWSGGPGIVGPHHDFGTSFAVSEGVSWLTVPGQLALSSVPLEYPVPTEIAVFGPQGAYGIASTDIDRDGDVDLLGTSDAEYGVFLWRNDGGDPPSWQTIEVDSHFPGGTSLHPADIDHDGDIDIVGASQQPGNRVSWWRNDDTDLQSWQRVQIESNYLVACNVFVADIDGDSWQDVLSTSWSTGDVTLWRNDGGWDISWAKQNLTEGQSGAHSAVAVDLDGDGDHDVVATAASVSSVFVFWNEGGDPIAWSTEVVADDLGGVRYAATADLDGSGTPDVVATGSHGQVVWWSNDGGLASGWERHTIDSECLGGHWVDLKDIDGDGHVDILVAAYLASSIHWYRNDGTDPPAFSKHQLSEYLSTPLTAIAADIDGRGDLEVIASESGSGTFSWWEISEFVPAGELTSSILDLGDRVVQPELDWQAHVPEATSLSIEVRTGGDPESMGSWIHVDAPGALPFSADRYLQYRILMSTEDPTVSPLVKEIRVLSRARNGDDSHRASGYTSAD